MYLQAFGIWIVLAIVSIINGLIRNFTYQRFLPELLAHQISTLTGIFFVGLVIFLWLRHKLLTDRQALLIGAFWFVLAVLFEFGFGHFIAGHSWEKLFYDYNILAGRIWVLFLAFILFGPYIINKKK